MTDGIVTVDGDVSCREVERLARGWLFASDRPDETVRAWIDRGGADLLSGLLGPTRAQVLGVTVELRDGSTVRFGGRVVKNVAGYDLTRAFVGARGELGRIVEAHLRIRPAPRGWHASIHEGTEPEDALSGPGCAVWSAGCTTRFLRRGETAPGGGYALDPLEARERLRPAWQEVRSLVPWNEGRARARDGVVLGGPRTIGLASAATEPADRGPLWNRLRRALAGESS